MIRSADLRRFWETGYLVLENFVDRETILDPVIAEYEQIMDELTAGWVRDGRLDADRWPRTFEGRIVAACQAGLEYFQPMDISLPGGSIKADTPFHAGQAVFRMMTDDSLLDVVESIIGPEITSNPIQHVRIKPPACHVHETETQTLITATDWHQDRAVAIEEADRTRMVTVWIAVTDATIENGCLQVIPGSNRGDMKLHCPNPQARIPDDLMDGLSAMPLPVKAGSLILLHPLTIHSSLVNETTTEIRWSFDLRYSVTGEPTGRPIFPSFVARSRANPGTELRDPNHWRSSWETARARLSADQRSHIIHRWSPDAVLCA